MCGICGAVSATDPGVTAEEHLLAMRATLQHRGPDEQGIYRSDPARDSRAPLVGLAHARLSIVDLSTGTQPLFNEDRTILTIANGEIYNYPDLARELTAAGHTLRTTSDCEAIVHLYEEYGLDFVHHLSGMFALALWDVKEGRLVLARDRMGVKPLHYYQSRDKLIFASEIKALLAHPLLKPELDLAGLYKYLTYEYVPSPGTIFRGVRKLDPGTMLVWEDGEVSRRVYWDLEVAEHDLWTMREEEYVDKLDHLLESATRRRLMSDVEVGILLSGGVDSSLVAALAQPACDYRMKAFTISFDDKSYDEKSFAAKAADAAGLELIHRRLDQSRLIAIVEQIPDIIDEPMADPSLAPTYLLSQLAAEHVKVVLSGDGGDDIMAGYVTFQALKVVNLYKMLPTFLRSGLNRLITDLPVSHRYLSLDFKLKQFMRGAGYSSEIMYFIWLASFLDQEKQALLTPEIAQQLYRSNTFEDVLRYLNSSRLGRDLERILFLTMKMYLQDDILVKVDRSSMACSLEVRSPFLDYELVEFVNSVPSRLKLKRLKTKYLIKKVAERHVPKEIVWRKKKGFGMPIAGWFKNELKELLTDYLSRERIARGGIFDPEYVGRLVDDHLAMRANNYKQLWTLLVFELWRERWLEGTQA